MSGNTIGTRFKVTTWGESHGPAMGVVVDGCPPGIKLSEKDIQKEVDRRKPQKNSKISTTRYEEDKVKILSGVFEGKTLGTPISIIVENKNVKSKDYSEIKNKYRPGHADYTYDLKYGFRDYRGGGRSSGRETIARVMAGAIAKKILKEKAKTEILGHTIQMGNLKAQKEEDSVGAIIEIVIKNPPKELGDPVFDKLDADLAKAMMSIGSIKGFEIGAGFSVANMTGSENNDQMEVKNGKIKFLSNNSGGILGGISTGENIIIRLAIKPVPSISKEQKTITKAGKNTLIKTLGRHDTCLAPRIIPIAESMAAIVLVDKFLSNC